MREPTAAEREAWDLAQIHQRRSRLTAKPIGSVVRRLIESSGYAETQSAAELQSHWEQTVGPMLASLTRTGGVTKGILLVIVANSATMQELHFRKKQVLASLRTLPIGGKVSDLKIRVGPID
jgi:hypothetical protein